MTTDQSTATFVLTNDNRVLVQAPAKNEWGFSLHSDDQEWPGGFGGATSWEPLRFDDPRISAADHDRLDWVLEDLAAIAE